MDGVNGYDLIDYIKQSIEALMNMKMEETEQTENDDYGRNYKKGYTDIDDPDINVQLPTGAIKGLKDATKNISEDKRLDTELM